METLEILLEKLINNPELALRLIIIIFVGFFLISVFYYINRYWKPEQGKYNPQFVRVLKLLGFFCLPELICFIFILSGVIMSLLATHLFIIIFLGQMGMAYLFFKKEKLYYANASTDALFRNRNLLYQFGIRYRDINFPINLDIDKFDSHKIEGFTGRVWTHLQQKLSVNLASLELKEIGVIQVSDKEFPKHYKGQQDTRKFLKIYFQTIRETDLNYFIYFKEVGKSIVVHFSAYRQTKYTLADLFTFILTGPFHFWIWIWDWYKGDYSIIAKLKSVRFSDNSFNDIDAISIDKAVYGLLLYEMQDFLRKEGLLTPQLENSINQYIQNITVSGGSVGAIAHTNKGALETEFKQSETSI